MNSEKPGESRNPHDSSQNEFEMNRVHEALAPLANLADVESAPAGLADRTLTFVRRQCIQQAAVLADSPTARRGAGWSTRLDVAVAACLLIVLTGLSLGGLSRLNQNYTTQACRNNLFKYFGGLESYASLHDGRFPELTPKSPDARTFVDALVRDGLLDARTSVGCPAVRAVSSTKAESLDYTYALGARGADGQIHGPAHQRVASEDSMPLLADRPLSGWIPLPTTGNHHNGANVLFVNGAVRFCTVPTVGCNGDHIYLNDDRQVAAGLHERDAVLGERLYRP